MKRISASGKDTIPPIFLYQYPDIRTKNASFILVLYGNRKMQNPYFSFAPEKANRVLILIMIMVKDFTDF